MSAAQETLLYTVLSTFYSKIQDSTTPARVGYNSGYGDLSLRRLVDRKSTVAFDAYNRKLYDPDEIQDLQALAVGSRGAVFNELDDFVRSGPFLFFKLPFEIRFKIFRLLLQPPYSAHPIRGDSMIQITLNPMHKAGPTDVEQDFEDAWQSHRRCSLASYLDHISLEELAKEKTSFLQSRRIVQHLDLQHPSRKGYNIDCKTYRELRQASMDKDDKDIDYIYLEWLRNASNVSTIFRKELSSVFWSRVGLSRFSSHCLYGKQEPLLSELLEDRPAIHKGIRYLLLFWDEEQECDMIKEFASWCKSVSKHLDLEVLKLMLQVRQGQLEDMSSGKGRFGELAAIRQFRVSQDLKIHLCMTEDGTTPEFDEDEDEARYDYRREVIAKYEPLIREQLLPDTLRKQPATDEKGRYLEARTMLLREDKDSVSFPE